jgi:hypothetical protein
MAVGVGERMSPDRWSVLLEIIRDHQSQTEAFGALTFWVVVSGTAGMLVGWMGAATWRTWMRKGD